MRYTYVIKFSIDPELVKERAAAYIEDGESPDDAIEIAIDEIVDEFGIDELRLAAPDDEVETYFEVEE